MSSVIKWFQDYITGTVAQSSENIRLNNVWSDGFSTQGGAVVSVAAAAATIAVTNANTNGYYYIPANTSGAGVAVSLASAATFPKGARIRFVLTGTAGQIFTITPNAAASDTIIGSILNNAAGTVTTIQKNGATTISILAAATAGTILELQTNGVGGANTWMIVQATGGTAVSSIS